MAPGMGRSESAGNHPRPRHEKRGSSHRIPSRYPCEPWDSPPLTPGRVWPSNWPTTRESLPKPPLCRQPRAPFLRGLFHGSILTLKPIYALAGCLTLALASCQPLKHDAWSQVGKGTNEITASTGWAAYEARVRLDDPTPGEGSASTRLEPNYGGGLRFSHFITDSWSLGLLLEYRSFDADPVTPLTAELDAHDYESSHFILANRFYGNTFGEENRWRVMAGIDLGYIPKIQLDATVTYPAALGGGTEDISVEGDSYATLGGLLGLTYMMRDNMAFSFGATYEFPLDSSDDSVVLTPPNAGGLMVPVDAEVKPDGFLAFVGLSFFL